ncbi:STAS domain-containing protein [Lentibacillus sp. N15]|uniref:STAS domain-containing protein n=1 Tax=Lentibacillus songyuanensis TaxID=3136161 RepID=UPI0031BB6EC2
MGKEKLHNYLIEHKQEMIQNWLDHDTFEEDSFYTVPASSSAEQAFSKQYQDLIQGLADFLIQPEDESRQHLIDWATKVAQDRVQNGTTIVEWITHFQSFCEVFWSDVSSYIKNTSSISKNTTILWADLFSSMFDTITKEFIKEYLDITEGQLKAQRNTITRLSSPVIPIASEIGVLPIIGEFDDDRAQAILNQTLTECVNKQISHLCMDLSGVPTIDTMVAYQIFRIITSLKMIGVKVTLSGISPEIAQTAVQMGIDFKHIPVQSTLQKALYDIGFKVET